MSSRCCHDKIGVFVHLCIPIDFHEVDERLRPEASILRADVVQPSDRLAADRLRLRVDRHQFFCRSRPVAQTRRTSRCSRRIFDRHPRTDKLHGQPRLARVREADAADVVPFRPALVHLNEFLHVPRPEKGSVSDEILRPPYPSLLVQISTSL